jgi:hypothetical protein
MANLIITDSDFNFILTRIGYPFISEDDLEISFDQIKEYCILPALHEYYKWFPLQQTNTYSVSGSFSIDFPDVNTFSAKDVRINTARNGQSYTGNPLINSTFIRSLGSFGGSRIYGQPYDYGMDQVYHYERIEGQSSIDKYKAFKVYVNESDRVVEGFSNITGTLQVIWAQYDNNFSSVPFQRKKDVQKLAQAYVLRFFGELRLQGEMNEMPVAFDGQNFVDRADDIEEQVITRWEEFTKVVMIRG